MVVSKLISKLEKQYPDSKIALNYKTPMELLVATMLSAQCTDERVNIVTGSLFNKYRNIDEFANAKQKILEQDVRSTGFYHNKAKNIINSARIIQRDFSGRVPDKMEDILKLPGVARKTANIVLGNAYGVVEGIAVDTHVIRLSQKLGLTKNKDPEKIEQDLMKVVPKQDWLKFSYLLQYLGRDVCKARKTDCNKCVLNKLCPSAFKT